MKGVLPFWIPCFFAFSWPVLFLSIGFFVFGVSAKLVWFALASAGIRDALAFFTRRPCAGRHLLFFAAAKKSRQKKAANTANISSCLRAPNRSYASHGSISVRVRCQRFE
ncbi:hypothetical protein [Paraburkholderia hospita]|uniref:hypothetical protein n=2 Tax=Paraburkholderia hospita TaxID=169430 RepID=UPI00115FDEF2|nr:hypothetical protein [Paraburkholderia hospita]